MHQDDLEPMAMAQVTQLAGKVHVRWRSGGEDRSVNTETTFDPPPTPGRYRCVGAAVGPEIYSHR